MSTSEVIQISRELILTGLLLTAPVIFVSLAVGLAISLFQTVTSIQEQTLSIAPRILSVAVVLVVMLPWSLSLLTGFTWRMMWRMASVGQ
ncbi:MAG: flagellar biosynthetic protein FliQ [Planctomycetaceae bacterium]